MHIAAAACTALDLDAEQARQAPVGIIVPAAAAIKTYASSASRAYGTPQEEY